MYRMIILYINQMSTFQPKNKSQGDFLNTWFKPSMIYYKLNLWSLTFF